MRAVDLIIKKRDGGELSREEIDFFIQGLTSGEIPDYQIAAWAMAVFFQGMTARETADLTLAMARSGETLDLSDTVTFAVDKHSTGGVGDKVTLVVEPLVAACGVPVGKMSGRGLGYSGGTIDKLESIPGFRVSLSMAEFKQQLKEVGVVLTGQSADLAPADGKLYALRDVTGTVNSIPLIASSVMSKKIAGGAQAIVLDVKVGSGAFMPSVAEASKLAKMMVDIGKHAGRKVVALISDMNQPLGHAVGNALEVREAIETLRGGGPHDFREHCLEVAGHLLALAGKARNAKAARARLEKALADGSAFAKFRQLVKAQGGDVLVIDDPTLLPKASHIETVPAPRSGYLAEVNAREIGLTAVDLGAGRAKKDDLIDYAVGLVVHHKVGDQVKKGEPLFTVHANDPAKLVAARTRVRAAHKFSAKRVRPLPLFYRVLKSRDEDATG
ncbi:MAG: pyrimidine-nucleoside phosphorylase [Anaerolineales bacterium]